MKKILSIGLVVVLILTVVVGCQKADLEYEDGTFNAELEADDNGWKSQIEITVEGGKITNVIYDEVDDQGTFKSQDEEYAETMKGVSGVTPAEAYEQLEEALIDKQDVDAVDAVSGATGSSDNFKALAKEVLKTK